MKTQILIPFAGIGKRFEKSHPDTPKPFIDVCGKPMLERVIENLNSNEVEFIFVSQVKNLNDNRFKKIIKNIKHKLVEAPDFTDGPACSCLLAEKILEKEKPLIITNCDQIILDFNLENLLKFSKKNMANGIVGVFHSNSSKNSYIKIDKDFKVSEIKEKIVISNIATNGLHFWENAELFLFSAKKMIENKEKYNNEFYVAPSYNNLIECGYKILPYYYNLHYPIGTPEDLKKFTESNLFLKKIINI